MKHTKKQSGSIAYRAVRYAPLVTQHHCVDALQCKGQRVPASASRPARHIVNASPTVAVAVSLWLHAPVCCDGLRANDARPE